MREIATFVILLASFVTLVCGTKAIADEKPATKLPAVVEPLLQLLPPDTETVIVTHGLLQLPGEHKGKPSLFGHFVRSVSHSARMPLPETKDRSEWFEARRVLATISGSRNFRIPKDLGAFPYDGCTLVRFDEADEEALARAFEACRKAAKRTETIAGHPIAVFQETSFKDVWTTLIAVPQPGLLMCATDREYLREVLERTDGDHEDRALPETLSEWKHVDTESAVWGIRHYSKERGEKDPTSPLRKGRDPGAIGLTFWYAPEGDGIIEARYLSNSDDALKLIKQRWSQPDFSPVIRQAERGVVSISTPIKESHHWALFLLMLGEALGHGVAL